ncbi:hypothetical protein [Celerinatantimonas sp. YJH-8]|uniref:hypothetical protein n=1 Tax=Celerinatantimonas sp. YJH-8 TaxID=3228714 RepID=UPI0038BFB038
MNFLLKYQRVLLLCCGLCCLFAVQRWGEEYRAQQRWSAQLRQVMLRTARFKPSSASGQSSFQWSRFIQQFPFPLQYWRHAPDGKMVAQWPVQYWPVVHWLLAHYPNLPMNQFEQLTIETRPATPNQQLLTLRLHLIRNK